MGTLRKSSKTVGFSLICCFLLGSLAPLAALIDPNPSCAMACARTSRCCCKKKPAGDSAGPVWAAARACGDSCRQVTLWLPLSIGVFVLALFTVPRPDKHPSRLLVRTLRPVGCVRDLALCPRPPPLVPLA